MAFAPDRSARRDTVSFALCVLLSGAALWFPAQGEQVSATIRSTVLKPVIWLQRAAEQGRTSRARFEAVVAQRDSAAMAALGLPALEAENRELRGLLGLGHRLAVSYIPADVLHQSLPTDGRTLLLGVGRAQHVTRFSPVVSPDGLVGVVTTVDEDHSVAMTWAHPDFRVSAFTEDGSVFGIVAPSEGEGAASSVLELRGVPYRDSIPSGVRIITSGLGGVYPNGIPVGTVIGVAHEERGWERTYLVRPAANPLRVTQVIVLTGSARGSVHQAFTPDTTGP